MPDKPTASKYRAPARLLVLVAVSGMLSPTGCKKKAEPRRTKAARGGDRRAARPAAADRAAEAKDRMDALPFLRAAMRAARRPGPSSLAAPPGLSGGSRTAGRKQPVRRRFADLRVVRGGGIPDMVFQHYGVNPTIDTDEQHVSTFAVDVDTASFALAAGILRRNALPPEAAIRVEEFLNAFDYGYKPPTLQAPPFSVTTDVLPSPHRKGYHVLRIGLKGRALGAKKRQPASLTFVIDTSSTMGRGRRLGLVKRALRLLVQRLTKHDTVAIVAYSSAARVVLPPTPGSRKAQILRALAQLTPAGSANAQAGLQLGFEQAAGSFRQGINRVLLCSDGVIDSGSTSAETILRGLQKHIRRGITLTAVGVGMGKYNDTLLEQLARGANGSYHYVDHLSQAQRIFVEKLTGTLQLVARDVKLQVIFDKRAVSRYRLLGYENRMLRKRDFAKSRVDGGELGAGQEVTALYEVRLRPTPLATPLGSLRIRYRSPSGTPAKPWHGKLPSAAARSTFARAAPAARLAVLVAAFAEKLRRSYWVRNLSYGTLFDLLGKIRGPLGRRVDVASLRGLVKRAEKLDRRGDKYAQILPLSRMTFDRVPVLR